MAELFPDHPAYGTDGKRGDASALSYPRGSAFICGFKTCWVEIPAAEPRGTFGCLSFGDWLRIAICKVQNRNQGPDVAPLAFFCHSSFVRPLVALRLHWFCHVAHIGFRRLRHTHFVRATRWVRGLKTRIAIRGLTSPRSPW